MVKPTKKSKVLSVVLAGTLAFGLCPTAAFAETNIAPANANPVIDLLEEKPTTAWSLAYTDPSLTYGTGGTVTVKVTETPVDGDGTLENAPWKLVPTSSGTAINVNATGSEASGYSVTIPNDVAVGVYRIVVTPGAGNGPESTTTSTVTINAKTLTVTAGPTSVQAGSSTTVTVTEGSNAATGLASATWKLVGTGGSSAAITIPSSNITALTGTGNEGKYTVTIPTTVVEGNYTLSVSTSTQAGTTSLSVSAAPLTGIKFPEAEVTVAKDATKDVTITDSNGNALEANSDVTWSSSDPSIATVDKKSADNKTTGTITGKAVGEATITATYKTGTGSSAKTYTATCKVTVGTKVTITPEHSIIGIGTAGGVLNSTKTDSLSKGALAGIKASNVTLSDSKIASASVASDVITVTGLAPGKVTVTAKDDDAFGTFDITVVKPTSIVKVTGASGTTTATEPVTLGKDGQATIETSVQPADVTGLTHTYKVDTAADKILKVEPKSDGKSATVKGLADGTGKVIVTTTIKEGSKDVIVGYQEISFKVDSKATNDKPGTPSSPTGTRYTLRDSDVSPISSRTYTGGYKRPDITVRINGVKLKRNVDYTVAYTNNLAAGKATVVIKGKGKYRGIIKKHFRINPAKVKIKSLSHIRGGFTVKLKKTSARNATGYQVRYSRDRDMWSSKVTSAKRTKTKTVTGLAKGKKYYVQVRAYKKVGSTKYYSKWSGVKKITIR